MTLFIWAFWIHDILKLNLPAKLLLKIQSIRGFVKIIGISDEELFSETAVGALLNALCFSGRSEKEDGCHGLRLAETFSTSPLKLPI